MVMKNEDQSDAPNKPITRTAKKTVANTVAIWVGLILLVSCIPLLNFIAVPIIFGLGVIVYAIFRLRRTAQSKSGMAFPDDDARGTSISPGQPGLRTNRPSSSDLVGKNRPDRFA